MQRRSFFGVLAGFASALLAKLAPAQPTGAPTGWTRASFNGKTTDWICSPDQLRFRRCMEAGRIKTVACSPHVERALRLWEAGGGAGEYNFAAVMGDGVLSDYRQEPSSFRCGHREKFYGSYRTSDYVRVKSATADEVHGWKRYSLRPESFDARGSDGRPLRQKMALFVNPENPKDIRYASVEG